jgi:phospholipid-binding lipoprotein MlaA
MKKICGIFIFSTLWFILSPNFSFCQSVEDLLPTQSISWGEPTEQFDRFAGVPQNRVMAQATKYTEAPSQAEDSQEDLTDPFEDEDDKDQVLALKTIADPLEPMNRAFFYFNDKLYFWLFKPVARGYGYIFPQSVRIGVRNFFDNLGFPIRLVNCVLQGKFEGAGRELTRFMVNTTLGMAGFIDVAREKMGLDEQDEDFGQTLGFYGLGPGFYIEWPIIGPSGLTDTVGIIGDIYTQPLNYVIEFKYNVAIRAYDIVNSTSLTIGEYEDLKRAALDPYVAMRDAYYQYRLNKIKE